MTYCTLIEDSDHQPHSRKDRVNGQPPAASMRHRSNGQAQRASSWEELLEISGDMGNRVGLRDWARYRLIALAKENSRWRELDEHLVAQGDDIVEWTQRRFIDECAVRVLVVKWRADLRQRSDRPNFLGGK